MKANTVYPLVDLPQEIQTTLHLIREELKSRRLFNTLSEVGFDNCSFRPSLDMLILGSLNMDYECDETFDVYNAIMEKRAGKIDADDESVMRQALKVYRELVAERKQLIVKG